MTEIPKLADWMKSQGRAGNKKRGDEFEAMIVSELQKQGFQVHLQVPSIKQYRNRTTGARGFVTKSADLFGCIDVVAFHPRADFTVFIQATTDKDMVKRKILDVGGTFTTCVPSRRVEIWTLAKGEPIVSDLIIWRQVKPPCSTVTWEALSWKLYGASLKMSLDIG